MPGIGGLYRLNGAAVEADPFTEMAASLRHRGPISFAWREGPIGLFCRYTAASGDSFARYPNIVVCADCRLDNRLELLGKLGLNQTLGDAELIAEAFRKWGAACPKHLLGDFAFAVWDAETRSLFCARDEFGTKPFYYHAASGRVFAFGSEIKALLSQNDVPRTYDEERIGDYLAGICSNDEYTFYASVKRLPSGCALVADPRGIRTWKYASDLSEAPSLVGEEWVQAFRERFSEAVRCRLRGKKEVGVTLSGGIDSSSVAAVASKYCSGIHTFSAVFENQAACDESSYIQKTVSRIRCTPHFIDGELSNLGELADVLRQQDEPFAAPNAFLPWRLYRTVAGAGIGTVLDGHGGDEVVSQGTGYLREMAAAGRWYRLVRELHHLTSAYDRDFWPVMLGYLGYGLRRSDAYLLRRLGRFASRFKPASGTPISRIVSPELARRLDLKSRIARNHNREQTEEARHRALIERPERAYAFEVLDRIANAFGVEPRYPFWDRRLVSLCLALPPEWKLRDGHGRYVLRRAMEEMLPDTVCWRRSKTNFLPNLIQGIREHAPKAHRPPDADPEIIASYVDLRTLEEIRKRTDAGEADLADCTSILNVALLGSWIQSSAATGSEDSVHQPRLSTA